MSHHDYPLEELSDISPYENYITAIRDKVTIDILDSAYDRKIILGLIMSLFSSAFDSRPRDSGANG